MTSADKRVQQTAMTRLAWGLCVLSVTLALASVALATVNGESPLELIANHHAIGVAAALILPVVGALIAVRDQRHLLAWLMCGAGVLLSVFNFTQQYAPLALGLTPRRLALPGGDLASWLASWTMMPAIVVIVAFLVLLFPDGRLPSRRWWPLAWAGAVAAVVPAAILAVGAWPLRGPSLLTQEGSLPPLVGDMFGIAFLGALLLGAIGVVSLVLRFRRAGAVQRQQIKWFAYGVGVSIPLSLFPEAQPFGPYLEFLGSVLFETGLAIGIVRYRLWDIDRLIKRTLVYGLLTAIIGGGYALGVLVLGQAVSPGRHPSSLVVAVTTLVIAAFFQPLRRRVQRAVDRRFDRQHYDAARTIAAFAVRLREQADLHALTTELLAVVDHTLQPTRVSIWLRPTSRRTTQTTALERPAWSAQPAHALDRDHHTSSTGLLDGLGRRAAPAGSGADPPITSSATR